jgi:CRP-like cAMP-binding protein/Fe-S-cluster-containing hydrogenase component 2/thioredoxin reductase
MAEPRRLPLRSHVEFAEGSREAVLEAFRRALEESRANVVKGDVTAIRKEADRFRIACDTIELTARHVILATGVMGAPRKLGFPGEDAPRVQYTLADPDAFQGKRIIVVGAGDSAIENALGLMAKNSVFLVNRSDGFPRAKRANREQVLAAIAAGKIRCFYDSTVARLVGERCLLTATTGDVEIACDHMIVRAGDIPPRAFLESCGIAFPSADGESLPAVDESYESNVPGLFLIGSLIGYPLIKQALNQGHEVVEHLSGNPIEPADQVILAEILQPLGSNTKQHLEMMRHGLPLFRDTSIPQFRELVGDSTVHVVDAGTVVFSKNDHTDTFWSVVFGSVGIQATDESGGVYSIGQGDSFGEMGLISGRRRAATVHALEKSVLLETKRNQILKLMATVPSIKAAVEHRFVLRALRTWIFPQADPALLAELAETAARVTLERGRVLFAEGEPADALYVILKGSVKISRKNENGIDVAQTYVSAGNYVGEMALVGDAPRSATVTAMVACELLRIEKRRFLGLLVESSETELHVRRTVEQRRLENTIAIRNAYSGDLLDFVLGEGVSDAANVLLIDSGLCIACGNCENACAATHSGYSRLDRIGGKSFASIQVPVSCRHCENPLCMTDCPPDALQRHVNGEVVIHDSCIGCGRCVENCPYGVIRLVHDKPDNRWSLRRWLAPQPTAAEGPARAAKCDLCIHLAAGPACVRACATGAAVRASPDEMMRVLADRRDAPVPARKTFLGHAGHRWLWVVVVSLAAMWGLYLEDDTVGGPSGASMLGYSYGTIATVGIAVLMGYGARKRSYASQRGTMKEMLSAHVWLGIALVFVVPLHCGFSFHWNVHTLAYVLLVLTVLTGVWGVAIYLRQPLKLQSHHGGATSTQLLHRIRSITAEIDALSGVGKGPRRHERSDAFLIDLLQEMDVSFEPSLWRSLRRRNPPRVDPKRAAPLLAALPEAERNDGRRLVELIDQKRSLICRLQDEARATAWLRLWLCLHIPVAAGLVLVLMVHIVTVLYY